MVGLNYILWGQHENKCGRQAIFVNCSMPEHCQSGQCQRPAKCANCSGDHSANSKDFRQWEKERKILKIKCENNLSFPEARKQFVQFYQARTYASAVKPGTCNKSAQTIDKSTQTDDSITEYTKEKTLAQTQDTQKEKSQGKSTSSSLPGPALKPATLEMMRKEEKKKKRRERESQKTTKRRKTKIISLRKRTKRKRSKEKSNTSSE